jgi:hypothetical protein
MSQTTRRRPKYKTLYTTVCHELHEARSTLDDYTKLRRLLAKEGANLWQKLLVVADTHKPHQFTVTPLEYVMLKCYFNSNAIVQRPCADEQRYAHLAIRGIPIVVGTCA